MTAVMDWVMAEFLWRKGRRRRFPLDDYVGEEDSWNSSDLSEDDYMDDDSYTMSTITDPPILKKVKPDQEMPVDAVVDVKHEVNPLLEKAAFVVAQTVGCEELERHIQPLDEAMLKKVAFWAFPQDVQRVKVFAKLSLKSEHDWQKGERMAGDNKVNDMRQVGFMVTASVTVSGPSSKSEEVKVSVTFEKQRITSSTCASCPDKVWCQHIIAVVVYRIQNANKIPVHAPVTETLSTLSRDQLQKLLQYAINEDPGGILGKVFKRIDAIRDMTSDENVTEGAPDPTFGVFPENKTHWDLVIEEMKNNLKDEFRYGGKEYAESYDCSLKERSGMYQQFIQRVVDLVMKGEVQAAGKVLQAIGLTAFQTMETPGSGSLWKAKRFLHDVMKLWTKYVIYFTGEARKSMIEIALDFNKTAQTLTNYQKSSLWAEVPTVALEFQNSVGVLDARSTAPFYEAICASLLPDAPEQYTCLIEGNVLPCDSCYHESVPVMLLRLEALKQWNAIESVKDKLSRLGTVILVKLLELTEQYSILNPALAHETASTSQGEIQEPPAKRRRKTKNSRKSKEKEKPSWQRPPMLYDESAEGIPKEQLCYSLLYLCHTMYGLGAMSILDEASKVILMKATVRAEELSRFRTVAPSDSVHAKEHDWLDSLEHKVFEAMDKETQEHLSRETRDNICREYVQEVLKHGLTFYRGGIPVQFINLLTRCLPAEDKDALQLCVLTVCHSKSPLIAFTIPHRDSVSYRYEYYRHHDRLIERFENILRRIFSRISANEAADNQTLLKVLRHFIEVEDGEFMYSAYKVLKENQFKLTTVDHKKACVDILVHCIKEYNANTNWRQFSTVSSSMLEFLTSLSKDLNSVFLKKILPEWSELCRFYAGNKLKPLIDKMKQQYSQGETLSKELVQMLVKFFDSKFKHDEDSCELLTFFEVGDSAYKQCLEKIKDNSDNYTSRGLLYVAKMEQERCAGSKKAATDVFTEDVNFLIHKAMQRLKEEKAGSIYSRYDLPLITGSTGAYLTWVFNSFVAKPTNTASAGQQFKEFVDLMAECFPDDPEVIITFFKTVDQFKPLLKLSKLKLGPKLLATYKNHFTASLTHASHTSYGRVLREMNDALLNCRNYVENGKVKFEEVLKHIRAQHKGKKKLLRMMDLEFPESK